MPTTSGDTAPPAPILVAAALENGTTAASWMKASKYVFDTGKPADPANPNQAQTNPFTTIEREDVGVTLKVTPQVNTRGFIKLTLTPEVSQKNGTANFGPAQLPIIGTRKATTQVSLKDGYTMGIGGLITTNSIKGASEFGITKAGQKLAGLLVDVNDVHALGLQVAQGLTFTDGWYWDTNDDTRKFAERYAKLNGGKYPGKIHAGVYSSVIHYLKAVEALKAKADGVAVVKKMKDTPTDDKLFGKGVVRADGRKTHPVYLVEIKTPAESKYAYDYYKIL